MRDGWREATLGEVASRRKDFTRVVADTRYRVVGVQRSGWGLVDRDPIRGDSMKFDKLLELHTDDLVYRTITAFEAPSAVVLSEFDGAFVTPQTFPTYTIDRDQLRPGYMALLTTAPEFHEAMSTRCVGSVLRRKTLSQGAFESIPIALPPLDEQRRIVDLIAAVDYAVDAAEAEATAAMESAIDLRNVYFADDAATKPLGEVAEVTAGKQLQSNSAVGELTPYLRAGNIANGSLDLSVVKEMALTEPERAKLALRDGDVVVVEGGNGFGKSAIWRAPIAGVVAHQNHVLRLRVVHDSYPTEYLSHWARWCHEQGLFRPTGSGIPNIGLGRARTMPIRISESEALPGELSAASGADVAADAARITAESFRTLRSNLLAALLSGEHEIPSSYDALLEEVA